MQQLPIVQKKIPTDQKVVENTKKDRREGKGRVLALSRRIYRLGNSDTFYVESESTDNAYYFIRYNPSSLVLEWYCLCKDNSIRGLKCKHIFAIEFAIKWGTIKDIDEKPIANIADQSTSNNIVGGTKPVVETKSYLEDDYDF